MNSFSFLSEITQFGWVLTRSNPGMALRYDLKTSKLKKGVHLMKSSAAKSKESPQVIEPKLDKDKAEAFAEKMLDVLNSAGLALMTSIGHRTGLFDAMSKLQASTSSEIARAAGLNERYVREWLGAMVTGGIVEFDPVNQTYRLPPEHSAFLTPAAIPNNIAVTTQFISVLGGVEDRIVECFRNGGGVPYSEYSRFHEVMAEESDQTVGAALLEAILPLAPKVEQKLRAGAKVLDVGCGSGGAICAMAEAFPASSFIGYDFSEEGISAAKQNAGARSLKNAFFEVKDVATLSRKSEFDLITAFDAIHDQARPAAVLRGIAEALKPDGTFLMQDIAGSSFVQKNLEHPIAPFCYTISCMHCMTVSLAQDGDGLGAMWGREKATTMLTEAGFKNIEVRSLQHDILNSYFIATKQ